MMIICVTGDKKNLKTLIILSLKYASIKRSYENLKYEYAHTTYIPLDTFVYMALKCKFLSLRFGISYHKQ